MSKFLAAALVVLPALSLAAGRPPEIDAVIDLARGAPGEFAADAMIRVAALDSIGKKEKIELLEDAFQRASTAQQPYKRRSAFGRLSGASGFLNRVYAQDLDALSLRLRAIEQLLAVDPRKARERFLELAAPQPPKIGCKDFLVYDVDRFYDVLGKIASQTFSAREIADQEPSKLLARYVGTINSAVEVAPVARLLASGHVRDADLPLLATQFAAALGKISGDDRSFTYAARQTGTEIVALAEAFERKQISPAAVVDAYRSFLINNLSGARCADDDKFQRPDFPADPAVFFNQQLRTDLLQTIQPNDITPSSTDGKADGLGWCEDPECQAIQAQYHGLVYKTDGSLYQPSEQKGEWDAKVADFLAALSSWRESSAIPAAQQFREKCGFFSDLLSLVPNAETRRKVLRADLDFLNQSRYATENRLEWFFPVNQLVSRLALDPSGVGRWSDDLRQAGDPVIALYVALERIAPLPAAQVVPML